MKKSWINNKTVIISGASGGIGFNVAKLLIEKHGCTVLAIARNEKKINLAKNSLKENSDKFIPFLFDVSVKENWENFLEEITAKGYAPDVLINNAGFMLPFTKFENLTEGEIEEILATNLRANIYSVKTLLPILKKSKTPAIINVSSAAGLSAVVGETMYCTTKFAMRGFTETLRQEYRKQIYVCGIYPGFIKTDILNRMDVSDKNNKLIQKLMMPVTKASKKIVRGIRRRKPRIVMGIDGHFMSFFSRLFPNLTPTLITKVLKASKLEMFENVFNFKGEK